MIVVLVGEAVAQHMLVAVVEETGEAGPYDPKRTGQPFGLAARDLAAGEWLRFDVLRGRWDDDTILTRGFARDIPAP